MPVNIQNEQRFNIVDTKPLIDFYNSVGEYRTETMKKADCVGILGLIDPVLRESFPFLDVFTGGNFYKHRYPYFPHTDHQLKWRRPSVNLVLPLWYGGSLPHLVVFDQKWKGNSITWTMTSEKAEGKLSSSTNTQVEGFPCDYPIEGKTGSEIDKHFHNEYLSLPAWCYRDLSGHAFPFTPNSVIIFDNTKIHCTGRFTGEKLGLSLRYTVKNN